jgi:uncharacterized secreted protein with C-terminal beta-propeller domain
VGTTPSSGSPRSTGPNPSVLASNANPLHQITSVDQLRNWIVQNSVNSWAGWFGKSANPTGGGMGGGGIMNVTTGGTMTPDAAGGATSGSGNTPVSGTNDQVAGVDEADILKTDGQYLYTFDGNQLLVIDVRDPSSPAVVGSVPIDGNVDSLYLAGDRVVVLSDSFQYTRPDGVPTPASGAGGGIMMMPAIMWRGFYKSQTVVTTIDVSGRTKPTVVNETKLDGWLVDSREVDDHVYLVLQNNLWTPPPQMVDTGDGTPTYETQDQYTAGLNASLDSALPGYTTTDFSSGTAVTGGGSLIDGANLYVPAVMGDTQLMTVAAFDPAAATPGPAAVTTVAGATGQVYASTDALYVASTDYSAAWDTGHESTQVYKFGLRGDAVPLEATGTVNGSVLNQFSMDESGGYFRIATTDGWGDDATNAVYVMSDTGGTLSVVGSVQNLAPGESIYSVDFEGDTGYVTTFEQVDPLFVLSLSDPTHPAVVGKLTIPGYSEYLQSLGDNLVLGLGRDADPKTGAVGGLQVSLFDVSDPAHPAKLDTFSFSTDSWGGWSDAEWDHHAISYFPDAGVVALPVSGDWEHPAALELLHVGTDGVHQVGEITHATDVLRSLRIGNDLFSMSSDQVQVHDLADPWVQVGSLDLPAPPTQDPGPIVVDPPVMVDPPIFFVSAG